MPATPSEAAAVPDDTAGDGTTRDAPPRDGERLEQLRARLDDLDDVPLGDRPALFEELDDRLSDELEALEEV